MSEGGHVTMTSLDGRSPVEGMFFPGAQTAHDVSDGYHTFGDLYDHRRALTRALARAIMRAGDGIGWRGWRDVNAWRSKRHHPQEDRKSVV